MMVASAMSVIIAWLSLVIDQLIFHTDVGGSDAELIMAQM